MQPKTPTKTFNEISHQNLVVDEIVDGMVHTALERIEVDHQKRNHRGDEVEVKKTSLMLLLFGLLGR